ncbi:MAG TPA: hypothetical protein VG964_00200 [Candidatus Saccharimonadales bacterium]|nr:hypothetical protein [Candidatus Saccharimonadales bacterium]
MKHEQDGFGHWLILLLVAVFVVIGFVGWQVAHKNQAANSSDSKNSSLTVWTTDQQGNWTPIGTPPACPAQPMLELPVDSKLISSILYPGQWRGATNDINNYKPHGGFRFDNLPNNRVDVRMPISGYVTETARYTVQGQTQTTFNIQNPCGVMMKFGHLLKLSPQFQAIANKASLNGAADSHTTEVSPPVFVNKGDLVATETGVAGNTFLDFGVYDLRSTNQAGQDPAYVSSHGGPIYMSLSAHGVCWLKTWFPAADEATLNNLPAGDSTNGKTSDYCK